MLKYWKSTSCYSFIRYCWFINLKCLGKCERFLDMSYPFEMSKSVGCFCRSLTTYKRPASYLTSFSRNWTFKNPAIWLAKSVLTHNSWTKMSPDTGYGLSDKKLQTFILKSFSIKSNDKIFQKAKRNYFGDFFRQKWIPS